MGAWLLRIARNAAIDHERRDRRLLIGWRTPDQPSPDPTPEEAAIGAEERREVRRLLATLPVLRSDAAGRTGSP